MVLSLEVYRNLPVRNVSAGEVVIEQGTTTGHLFVLIEGKVDMVKEGQTVATSAQAGDIFGDISALLGRPHTTSVRASRDSSFYVVEDARTFLEQNPAVCMHLCELLARRLVSVTDYLVNLQHQFTGHDHMGMVNEVLDSLLHRHPRVRVPPRSSTINATEIPD